MLFKEVSYESLKVNPFVMLKDEWALLSAGDSQKHNTMTVAWGSFGVMWSLPVLTVVVRPQRYTCEFIENSDLFTVCFFPDGNQKALGLLGTKSGRDCDKIAESGLIPMFIDDTLAFEESNLIFVCRKLHGGQQLDASKFVDKREDAKYYPEKDYHFFYIGEVVKVLKK